MSYNLWPSITLSDTVDLPQFTQNKRLTDAIYVANAGAGSHVIVVVDGNGATTSFTVVAGLILPVGCRRVNSTGSDGTVVLSAFYVI